MHQMTRVPNQVTTRAPFAGETFVFKSDKAVMSHDHAERFVEVQSQSFGRHVYKVTRVIGGRHREDFAGVEVESASASAAMIGDIGVEKILPVTFQYKPNHWRYKGYSVMSLERPGLRAGPVWSQTCLFCHNTVATFSTLLSALYGPNSPGYQGQVPDPLLPENRRWQYQLQGDEQSVVSALQREVQTLGIKTKLAGSARDALKTTINTTRKNYRAEHLIELGIGCESCHLGAAQHVKTPTILPSYLPTSPLIRVEPNNKIATKAESINRTCARCHQVLFSRYPFTWEGGLRRSHPGGSHISSGEARDMMLGGCANQMACSDCHHPHEKSGEKINQIERSGAVQLCTKCHSKYETEQAQRAHSHHDPNQAGGKCLSCHMPQKNMSLDNTLTRYHRIGSPTDTARVEEDRPLECALCHSDWSVRTLVETMERWWNKKYDRQKLSTLYGTLDDLPILATIARGKAHEQATAMHIASRDHVKGSLPLVAGQMLNPYPIVRFYAQQGINELLGKPCAVDVNDEQISIRNATNACLQPLGLTPSWRSANSSVVVDDSTPDD